MDTLKLWVQNVLKYPPSELFYEKYGKEAKAEKRIIDICEKVYYITPKDGTKNILQNLRSSFRDFEVLYNFGLSRIKPQYTKIVSTTFLESSKDVIKELDALFKQDQVLQMYYKPWKVPYKDISDIVYNLTKDTIK